MGLTQYFENIKTINKLDIENPNIENLISKLQLSKNIIEFTLEELFQNSNVNNEIILNPKLLKKIETNLNLLFIKEEEIETNICFANYEEIRSEYKQSFRLGDLMNYITAFANSLLYKEHSKIIITEDFSVFWKMVKLGSQLKNQKQ